MNVSGASDKTNYYFSFGYTDQEGMLKKNTFKRLSGRLNLDHKVSDRISLGGSFTYSNSITAGIDYLNSLSKEFQNPMHGDGVNTQGSSANLNQRFKRENWQNLVTFDQRLGQGHNVNLFLGNEQQFTFSEGWGAQWRQVGDSYFDEFQGGYVLIVPSFTAFPNSNFLGESYLLSFFGRLNYDYKKKYFLSINGRRDGYSAFAPGKKYGNFGGVSAGWTVSEEGFFKSSGIANRYRF